MTKQKSRGLFWLVFTVLIWGVFLPVSKQVLGVIDPYWLTLMRYSMAALVLGIFVWRVEGAAALVPPHKDYGRLLALGILVCIVFGVVMFEGLKLTRPEHAQAIMVLTPIHVALFRAVQTRKMPGPGLLACVLMVVCGAVLLVTRGNVSALTSGGSMFGNFLMLVASIAWATYTVGAQSMQGYSALRFTTLSCFFGVAALVVVTLLQTGLGHAHIPSGAAVASVWPQLLFMGVIVSAISVLTWNVGVRAVGAMDATLISSFTPVIAFAVAFAEGQRFVPLEILGAGLILAAIILNNLLQRRALAIPTRQVQ